jgi:hypothetical protein
MFGAKKMTKEQILVLKERTSIVFNNEVTLFKRSNLKEVYDNFRNKKLVYFFENEIVDIDLIDFAKEEDIEKYIAEKEEDLNDLKGNLIFGIDLSKEQFLKAKKEIYNKLYYSMNEFYNLIFKYEDLFQEKCEKDGKNWQTEKKELLDKALIVDDFIKSLCE